MKYTPEWQPLNHNSRCFVSGQAEREVDRVSGGRFISCAQQGVNRYMKKFPTHFITFQTHSRTFLRQEVCWERPELELGGSG